MDFTPTSGGSLQDLPSALSGYDGFIWTDAIQFAKAVQAGYGSDVSTFTGGRAIQLQSIEHSLLAAVQKNEDFKAFNSLSKTPATATVDEYMQQTHVGGFLGGSYNDELGVIAEGEGNYKRRILEIKYLMTMRRVSVVQANTKTAVDTISNQTKTAILQILSDAEWGVFYGDSSCSAQEFDGAEAIITSQANSDHVIDLRGNPISPAAVEFITSAQLVSSYGSFGKLTDAYMSNLVASDIDQKLDPAFRINISTEAKSVKLGAPVTQIVTRWGKINVNDDIFIREGEKPFASRSTELATIASAAGVTAPATVTVAVAPNADSQFVTAHAGLYYWAAEGGSKAGRSLALTKSTGHTVASGDGATLTITADGGANETYYMIYRSRRNGTNGTTDFREMVRVPKAGATTEYVDLNQNVPGTSKIFCFSQRDEAIVIRRLLPMTKFPLYPSNTPVIPWAHLLFLALRVGLPNQHTIIKNVLPAAADWQPF